MINPPNPDHFDSQNIGNAQQVLTEQLSEIQKQLAKVIVGQEEAIFLILAGILSRGHVILQGVPGLAKTLLAKAIARTLGISFSRIQFTPDLMPSDIVGTSIYNTQEHQFEFKAGPVFAQIVLADEINRAPAKTQSALFEAMEERQVSVDGKTYELEQPFTVLATQNPVEYEGTYRLPEAQLDRFLFLIELDYPSIEQEISILQQQHKQISLERLLKIEPIVTQNELINFIQHVQKIHVEPQLFQYIAQLVHHTRRHPAISLGGSPRASLGLLIGSKALAALQGRDYIIPDDVRKVVVPVLRHRLILTPEKEIQGISPTEVLQQVIAQIEVPR
jgi:MoxR-like ATPase